MAAVTTAVAVSTAAAVPSGHGTTRYACGLERWNVKTLQDRPLAIHLHRPGRRADHLLMPLYEDLARRALAAQERAASLQVSASRSRELASLLRRAHKGEVMVRRCAWCSRLAVGGEWLHLEAIGEGQQRIATSLLERSTNGICPGCFQRVSDDAEASRCDLGGQ